MFDSGDLELVFGNAQTALGQIEERARTILNDGKLPFMVGGEHLVTLGSFRAVQKKYPDVSIIHLMRTPTCAPITWGSRCPTRACCGAAMSLWATGGFSIWHPLRRQGGVCLG